ncbi:16S rRNA (cytosine(967)-C(5))-methyltransferase RsmB [Butyrivibrio sp. XPD2002]|jgi:16S rRNA (cytosine967-C5)-methyltransferase|uniref:16S rRNA (cytosine(967)-C(5))-methyltransferase RsmB n=1 Tax=Butyrivibrio sp. XPD2002 TaxID=1280665 RepID=UPI00041A5DE6|nr:16S rRNA (cytosine(967)-C(5))-methyltransferase RsmB [Butyrivibrio sp. XPD2002]MCR5341977.1 16S rRNA (cytosine(967)-C(5))-methyltransferase RsmB [Butyrivibrio sp.]
MAGEINERRVALDILTEMGKSESHQKAVIKLALNKYDYLEAKQKSFIKCLAEGTIERQITLDYVISQFSKTPIKKMAKPILYILRMGVYQILYMDSVPDSAAVNEAVKLAQKLHFIGLKGFVNAVLRNVSRKKDEIVWPDPGESTESRVSYLSVKYSEPEWLAAMFMEEFGFKQTAEIFKFFLEPRPVTVRFSSRFSAEQLRSILAKMKSANNGNIVMKPSPLLHYAMDLYHTDNIKYIPGFEEGAFMVQDISSMLVTEVAELHKGDTVIDVCAAPGGKSLHAADVLSNTGKVISRDISENKCILIRDNITRMGYTNVTVQEYDAERHDASLENRADVLYCDLPCSGLGVIGRKPDIKMNTDMNAIMNLQQKQRNILNSVWNYVKPGGTLIYSTCTLSIQENEDNFRWILDNLPFEAVSIVDRLPGKMKEMPTAGAGYIRIIPGEFGTDGFFIAKFKRKEE